MPHAITTFTTPRLEIEFEEFENEVIDLNTFEEIHVTFRQGAVEFDIPDPEIISSTVLRVHLTQEQTARLKPGGEVGVMVNFMTAMGDRIPSEIVPMIVGDNLLRRVI